MTAPRDLAAEARAKADTLRINLRPATALLLAELADRIDELEAAQREPSGYVIGTDIGTDPGRVELYEDRVLTKEESAEWLENLKTNQHADAWRAFELHEVTE